MQLGIIIFTERGRYISGKLSIKTYPLIPTSYLYTLVNYTRALYQCSLQQGQLYSLIFFNLCDLFSISLFVLVIVLIIHQIMQYQYIYRKYVPELSLLY